MFLHSVLDECLFLPSAPKPLICVPVSFPSLLVPCTFSFISLCLPFTFSSIFLSYSTISVSILITSVWKSSSDRLAIFSLFIVFFWSFDMFFHLGLFIFLFFILFLFIYFCHSTSLMYSKGLSFRNSPGQGNQCCCFIALYVGEGSLREQCHLVSSPPAFTHFLHYPQENWPLLVLIPGWGGCVHSTTLWISPKNSPVGLGVSPAT